MNKGKKFIKGVLITLAVLVIVAAIGVLLWYVAKQNDKLPTIFTGGQVVQTSAETESESAPETEESVETAESEETRQETETVQQTQGTEVRETAETTPQETAVIETEESAEAATMETTVSGNEVLTVSGNEIAAVDHADNNIEETSGENTASEESAEDISLWVSTAGGSIAKANEITGYDVEWDDFGLEEDQGPAITAKFEKLIFTGTNADRTNWLNNQIQKLEDAYRKQVEDASLSEKQQELAEAGFSGTLTYSPKTAEQVYFEGSVASIVYQSVWYEDGIRHQCWDTLNVDTSTRKSIPLQDVLGMSLEETHEIIIQALQSQYGVSRNRVKDIIQDKTEFSYYYDETAIQVCFDSYELGLPDAEQMISMSRPDVQH